MLFDLRGRGRRRTVQVIYATLALLMGGGLIFFGIGSDASGGLIEGCQQQTDSNTEALQNRVNDVQKQVDANPRNAAAWASLARAQYNLAVAEGLNEQGQFSPEAKQELRQVRTSWAKHVALTDEPNSDVATLMVQAYSALNDSKGALAAQEIIVEARPSSAAWFRLLEFALIGDNKKVAKEAAKKAVSTADSDQRAEVRKAVKQLQQQIAQYKAIQQLQRQGGTGPSGPSGPGGTQLPIGPNGQLQVPGGGQIPIQPGGGGQGGGGQGGGGK